MDTRRLIHDLTQSPAQNFRIDAGADPLPSRSLCCLRNVVPYPMSLDAELRRLQGFVEVRTFTKEAAFLGPLFEVFQREDPDIVIGHNIFGKRGRGGRQEGEAGGRHRCRDHPS